MPTDNRNIRREFSYTRPILYAGESYPSADSTISDENGNETKGRIFTDANGQYYTLGANGFPIPVMPKEMLDEVTVSAPRDRESLFKNYLLGRNDNTQVTNLPHREYNSNLTEAGLRGAAYHADWDRQHPNLSAWRDAITAVPFAVAAAPAVIGGGQAALGTSLGQAALGLGSRVMANPIVDAANTALGLGFAAKGAYDVSQGEFSPQTAMELSGLYPVIKGGMHLVRNINDYNNLNKFINRYGYTEYNPKFGLIFNDTKLDQLTNQLVKQHNRFTRGVSIEEARKYYGFPDDWTDEQIAKYTLTHPHSPTLVNSGGNPNQESVLYTSNSIDLAKQYTDKNGYIGILQRPIVYDADRSKMLKLNDFRFNRQPDNPLSATTDEPYIYNVHTGKPKSHRIRGGMAYKKKGRLVRTYTPVQPTFLDAQANAGAYIMPTQLPDDINFRHYLFYGEPEEEILGLEKLIKYTKPEGSPSVDYKPYSTGFSKKKAFGGEL